MYRFMIGITAAALSAGIGVKSFSVPAKAAAPVQPYQTAQWVDEDGDGICDNQGTRCQGQGFIDADGDGICDNQNARCQGQSFTDANGDGICDNAGNGQCTSAGGAGRCMRAQNNRK